MPQPQARILDMHMCTVPVPMTPPPFPAPIIGPCSLNTLVMKMPAARSMQDQTLNGVGVPHPFLKGSMTVLINGTQALRAGDMCASGGPITPPCATTVLTGG